MRRVIAIAALALALTGILMAQGAYTPYGLDIEIPNGVTACTPSSCPILDWAQQAKAQWVRVFLPWSFAEPNPPTGPRNPSVMGSKSGVHTYNWEYIDNIVDRASTLGINVLVTFIQAPAWANGNPDPNCCSWGGTICAGGRWSNAWPVTDTTYLEDFAYNAATRLNGRVWYYEVWNEPNLSNNFNPEFLPDPDHQYLNYFMQYYTTPIYAGLKAVNTSISLAGLL